MISNYNFQLKCHGSYQLSIIMNHDICRVQIQRKFSPNRKRYWNTEKKEEKKKQSWAKTEIQIVTSVGDFLIAWLFKWARWKRTNLVWKSLRPSGNIYQTEDEEQEVFEEEDQTEAESHIFCRDKLFRAALICDSIWYLHPRIIFL